MSSIEDKAIKNEAIKNEAITNEADIAWNANAKVGDLKQTYGDIIRNALRGKKCNKIAPAPLDQQVLATHVDQVDIDKIVIEEINNESVQTVFKNNREKFIEFIVEAASLASKVTIAACSILTSLGGKTIKSNKHNHKKSKKNKNNKHKKSKKNKR